MKELKITPPEGYEIDPDKSNLEEGVVEFRKIEKKISYYEVFHSLDFHRRKYFIEHDKIDVRSYTGHQVRILKGNEASGSKQLEALLAINKLKNVANYLNGDSKLGDWRWTHYINSGSEVDVVRTSAKYLSVFFNNYNDAIKAIEILGEDTIKLALYYGSM